MPDLDSGHARRHAGNVDALSRRHQRECSQYGRLTDAEQRALQNDLLKRIADTRTLRQAARRLAENGDKAPGPNRERLKQLLTHNPKRVDAELRKLRHAILDGTYRPGPVREIKIPKTSGRGTRTIAVANWQDLVVQRAIAEIIQPLLDPGFEDMSYGFRPGRDRAEALARVAAIAENDDKAVLITADVSNAFDNVPHRQLLERLRQHLHPDVVRLIERVVVSNSRKARGVPQGGPLSPLLLNVYLDAFCDKKWMRRHPDCPIVRVADDILILCNSVEQAQTCYADLHRMIRTAGMTLKVKPESDIRHLSAGDTAEWLGVSITLRQERLVFEIPETYWKRLRIHLERQLQESDGPVLVRGCLRGVMDQLGACYRGTDKSDVLRRLASIVRELRVPEAHKKRDLMRVWRKSAARYEVVKELWKALIAYEASTATLPGQGSATGQPPRSDSTEKTPEREQITLAVSTAVQMPNGIGCWGYAIWCAGHSRPEISTCILPNESAETCHDQGRRAVLAVLESDGPVHMLEVRNGGNPVAAQALPPNENPMPETALDFVHTSRQLDQACRRQRTSQRQARIKQVLSGATTAAVEAATNQHGPSG